MDKMCNPFWNAFVSGVLFSYVFGVSLLGMFLFPKEIQE